MSLEFLSLDSVQSIAQQYGYWSVFIGIALENMGIPLPGETISLIGGFLAGSGELNYWFVLITVITGAVLGDNVGYWIGKVGGWPFLLRIGKFFNIPTEKLEEAKSYFRDNAAKAVFFGRFVTLLRIFAGPMAGIVQMPYQNFLLCNFGGATLWASIIVTASFFLGRLIPLEQMAHWIADAGTIALALIVLWFLVPKLLQRIQAKS